MKNIILKIRKDRKMKVKKVNSFLVLLMVFMFFTATFSQDNEHQNHMHKSHYVSDINNEIKSLSEDEINQLLNGDGMGLAKAGELNSYPGPRHILDLSKELNLTEEQIRKTQVLYDTMKAEAVQLGKLIIEKERELDLMFKNNNAEEDLISKKIMEISELKGKLRFVHLKTHLKQKEILTGNQVTTYNKLRGYN